MNSNISAIILSFIAGASTLIGCLFMLIDKKYKNKALSFTFIFSFIIIISVCIFDLAPTSYSYLLLNSKYPFLETSLFIIIGIYIGKQINKIDVNNKHYDNKLYRVGLISFLIIILHNIPEGIITYITNSSKIGIMMCIVIALHNIPEGIMISLPIYYSTKSKFKAFKFTLVSALSEPFGAIISYLFLSRFITDKILGISLAFVCGLMLHIVIDEISPLIKIYNDKKYILLGIIVGILLFAIINIIV